MLIQQGKVSSKTIDRRMTKRIQFYEIRGRCNYGMSISSKFLINLSKLGSDDKKKKLWRTEKREIFLNTIIWRPSLFHNLKRKKQPWPILMLKLSLWYLVKELKHHFKTRETNYFLLLISLKTNLIWRLVFVGTISIMLTVWNRT